MTKKSAACVHEDGTNARTADKIMNANRAERRPEVAAMQERVAPDEPPFKGATHVHARLQRIFLQTGDALVNYSSRFG
jgi:hypothetical protein